MKQLRSLGFFVLLMALNSCNGPTTANSRARPASPVDEGKVVGGGCDGCELMYVGMPTNINSVDTSAGWSEPGQKLLVAGTVYKADGKAPAANVILYYWQTDNSGRYSPRSGMEAQAKRHGHLRGWVKSAKDGRYALYTVRPAPYPSGDVPAHIHLSVKEPNVKDEYYTDDLVFDDDSLLTEEKRKALAGRGGSGILRISLANGVQVAAHDVFAGRNIPNYPKPSQWDAQ